MTQEVVKVTGSCRLFCAFSICDSLERHNAAKTRRYACCPCLLPSFLSEGISNCFKTLEAASLFLFAIVWHHLEHERLSNFSNFCKTKACWPYFGIASKAIPYFQIEISLFSLPFPFMQEKQGKMQKFNRKIIEHKSYLKYFTKMVCFCFVSCEIPKWLLHLMDWCDKIWACTKYIDAFR